MKKAWNTRHMLVQREGILCLIIMGIILLVGARAPVFLTWQTALDVANDSAILVLLVVGQMMVLITRGVDLSVASNLALTGMVCALAGKAWPGFGLTTLVPLAMLVGCLLGAVNGWLITRFNLPSIVVTLGTLSAYRGAIFLVSHGTWV